MVLLLKKSMREAVLMLGFYSIESIQSLYSLYYRLYRPLYSTYATHYAIHRNVSKQLAIDSEVGLAQKHSSRSIALEAHGEDEFDCRLISLPN